MPQLPHSIEVLPSLLDRLISPKETAQWSVRTVLDCVKQDLERLFNTRCIRMKDVTNNQYPNIQSSVLNYGIPDLVGKSVTSVDEYTLTKILQQVIESYEPRIIPETLKVSIYTSDNDSYYNTLSFDIKGNLQIDPMPSLHFLTHINIENHTVEVKDY